LKFNEAMPIWMAKLIRKLNLRSESYSKYCTGLDAWMKNPNDESGCAKTLEAEG